MPKSYTRTTVEEAAEQAVSIMKARGEIPSHLTIEAFECSYEKPTLSIRIIMSEGPALCLELDAPEGTSFFTEGSALQ